jgi:uncharacterized protein (TIGR00251 family)
VAGPVRPVADGVRVSLRVTPRSGRDAVRGLAADAEGRTCVKLSVTAAPEDGKANAAVVALLAKAWRVPKSALSVVAGATDRSKVLHVAGDPADLAARLDAWCGTLDREGDA